MSIIDISGG